MAPIQQLYAARFALGTDRRDFKIGGHAIALTTGYYYLFGYPTETAVQFIEHMQAAIRAEGTYPAATVTVSNTTGIVTIATGGAAAAISWDDAGLQTMLGFTGTQPSATSHVGSRQARYLWLPSRALSAYPCVLQKWWDDRYTGKSYRSPTGTTYGLKGNQLHEGFYQYRNLLASEVVTDPDSVSLGTFQQFYEDTAGAGNQPFRVYPDRTDARIDGAALPDSEFYTACFASSEESVRFSDVAKKGRDQYHGYWDVSLDLHEWIQS